MKRRGRPEPGSIPDLLDMFGREVRFYREVAPEIEVRVPALVRWDVEDQQVTIQLEDLSSWDEGGDPVALAGLLKQLHDRWRGLADARWPWLNRAGRAAQEIGALYDKVWTGLRDREDITPAVRRIGDALSAHVAELERLESSSVPRTLVHGDASLRNVRTSPRGVIALLDWEDVRTARGEVDLSWLLVSSVDPAVWPDVIAAYEPDAEALVESFPANIAQAILSLADHALGSVTAQHWITRLDAAAAMLD